VGECDAGAVGAGGRSKFCDAAVNDSVFSMAATDGQHASATRSIGGGGGGGA